MDYNDSAPLNRYKSAQQTPAHNVQMGPRLKHSLNIVERQNEIKAKLKKTFIKLDEGKNVSVLIVIDK